MTEPGWPHGLYDADEVADDSLPRFGTDPPDDPVLHHEADLLVMLLERRFTRLDGRLDAIDTHGTRAMSVLAERLRELQRDVTGHLEDHERQEEQAEVLRRQLRQWKFTAGVAALSLLTAVLSLVLHFLNLY